MKTYYYFRFCPSSWKCRNALVHIPAYSCYHCQTLIFQKHRISVVYIIASYMRSLLLVAKPVSWTLDPDRPRKTGSRYNDTQLLRKAKRVYNNVTKSNFWFHCLLGDFWLKLHWGYFYAPSPLPGQGLSGALQRLDLYLSDWWIRLPSVRPRYTLWLCINSTVNSSSPDIFDRTE